MKPRVKQLVAIAQTRKTLKKSDRKFLAKQLRSSRASIGNRKANKLHLARYRDSGGNYHV